MAEERGRGHLTSVAERLRILLLIAEAVSSGCRKVQACEAFGLEIRTVQRWESKSSDERRGPITAPANKLTSAERNLVIRTSIGATFANLSPRQIVPKLADDGIFIASESIFYRILKAEKLNMHRGHTKPRIVERPKSFEAYRPNQIYSWDIHETQEADLSSILLEDICLNEKINKNQITVHSDNGGPMKGATMLATLERLGVMPSFSRPSVSNDNPYSESMFKTLKYCPMFPTKPFEGVGDAKVWMSTFTKWYNTEHYHSGIKFVTPASKHDSLDLEILKNRIEIYEKAKQKNPNRWSGKTRNLDAVTIVKLNPLKEKNKSNTKDKLQLAS